MRVWEDKESGVKKHRVSYITGAALIAGLVFLLIGLAILVAIVIVEKVEFYWAVYANFAILIITIIIYIIGMFTSMSRIIVVSLSLLFTVSMVAMSMASVLESPFVPRRSTPMSSTFM